MLNAERVAILAVWHVLNSVVIESLGRASVWALTHIKMIRYVVGFAERLVRAPGGT